MPAPFPSSYIHVLFKGLKHLRYEHVRACVRACLRVCVCVCVCPTLFCPHHVNTNAILFQVHKDIARPLCSCVVPGSVVVLGYSMNRVLCVPESFLLWLLWQSLLCSVCLVFSCCFCLCSPGVAVLHFLLFWRWQLFTDALNRAALSSY